jgi:sporadic carbohydrate cluster protein (TIGR04323 family)
MNLQIKKRYFTYIVNKKFGDYYLPTRFQYVILRDYYQKINANFILPQGEPIFSNTKIRLRTIIKNLKFNEGLILLSIYQLPENKEIRESLLKQLIKKKIELHFIFEGLIIKNKKEFKKINTIFKLNKFINAN